MTELKANKRQTNKPQTKPRHANKSIRSSGPMAADAAGKPGADFKDHRPMKGRR